MSTLSQQGGPASGGRIIRAKILPHATVHGDFRGYNEGSSSAVIQVFDMKHTL